MKILVAAIIKICASYNDPNSEAMLDCFDKYVNCTVTEQTIQAKKPEVASLKRLNLCQYGVLAK